MNKKICKNCGRKLTNEFQGNICSMTCSKMIWKRKERFTKENLKNFEEGYVEGRKSMKLKKSVRLASKSVDLKALREYCDEHVVISGFGIMPFIFEKDLVEWAEKEAKKKSEGGRK